MSETVEQILNEGQDKLRKILQETAVDLWGATPGTAMPTRPAGTAGNGAPMAGKPQSEPVKKLQFPALTSVWKTADETVDWTEVLAHDRPADGLTTMRLWEFYRKYADRVLKGDLQAYVDVLSAANPLGDLTPFAANLQMRTPDADTLQASYECCPEYMKKARDLYLCGLSLRIARDLFAVLPVRRVQVEATENGVTVFRNTFERDDLRNLNFKFLDPVAFAKEHGAQM